MKKAKSATKSACTGVAKSNLGSGQKVGEFSDFSFLAKDNFDDFIAQVKTVIAFTWRARKIKEKREKEIDTSLTKLNNDIYQNEKGLGENDRVFSRYCYYRYDWGGGQG